jgi:hypothetical protein
VKPRTNKLLMPHRRHTHEESACISVSNSNDKILELKKVEVNETAFRSAGNFNY